MPRMTRDECKETCRTIVALIRSGGANGLASESEKQIGDQLYHLVESMAGNESGEKRLSPWLTYHATHIYTTLSDALAQLKVYKDCPIPKGYVNIDPKRPV